MIQLCMIQSGSALKRLSREKKGEVKKKKKKKWPWASPWIVFSIPQWSFSTLTIFLNFSVETRLQLPHVHWVYALLSISIHALFFKIISQGVAGLRHPRTLRPFFFIWTRRQKHIDLFILFTLSSLSLSFPHVLLSCHILPLHLSVSPLPAFYIPHSLTPSHTKKHVLTLRKLCPCAKTDTVL